LDEDGSPVIAEDQPGEFFLFDGDNSY